ncbi:thiamine pyrophosphate-binding protein [Hahella sp. CCB-MM4]|uniref:thiamine pyrophosphate-binding protein n=1 Tax=Hahella sp. (strain CCB-MM4) TaxID=1926491 RepID=UPI000B9B92F0|nr:thiamine pyrophosphate-binding protein [Hahella sp. CCB-MM4]OZG70735.1 thiamine pyrophosphate-binding protein [Hahella sp. CCB-MM4]
MEPLPRVMKSPSSTCTDLLIDFFSLLDIRYIFGVPGGNIDPLCHRLAQRRAEPIPRWILTRSEAGAAYMADGYFRETGKIGVCGTTSGPGATNLLTPIANAFVDNIPLLAITAQTPISTFGRGAMQETSGAGIDSMLMFEGCTRYNSLVSHPDQLIHKLHLALSNALGLTPGPVHLSIPSDILTMPISAAFNDYPYINRPMEATPDKQLLNQLRNLISGASKAVFALGPGAEEAMSSILKIAETLNWPIVTFPMSRGLINARHPLFRGVFGTAGHESARLALSRESAPLVFVVGADLDETATCGWDGTTILSSRMIHVSNNPEQLSRSYMARLNVLGSPRVVFNTLVKDMKLNRQSESRPTQIPPNPREKPDNFSVMHWEDCITDASPLNPRQVFTYVSSQIPGNTRVYVDTGNSFYWSTHYWMQNIPDFTTHNLVNISMGFATMGWAIGASIGCKFGHPEAPVLCITGDGSVLMSSLEFTVSGQNRLNVVFMVMNNGSLGTIRHGQKLRGFENTANTLPEVNYALMGRAMGIESYRVCTMDQLRQINWGAILNQRDPVILDLVINGDVAPPIGQRINALGRGAGNDSKVKPV